MSAHVARQHIQLRGVRVHNLKNIDLDIPLGKITAISGLSGSGKSSLAFDTLYAEGQRRYIESFSAYARRFLDRLDKPDADRIDNLPPAIALRQNDVGRRQRETIAAVTEIDSYLRLLFARLGRIVCPSCEQLITRATPQLILTELATIADGTRLMLGFHWEPAGDVTALLRLGFNRALVLPVGDETAAEMIALSDASADAISARRVLIITDRVVAGRTSPERLTESIEIALREGAGRCVVLIERQQEKISPLAPVLSGGGEGRGEQDSALSTSLSRQKVPGRGEICLGPRSVRIDNREFALRSFSTHLECADCGIEFLQPQPQLFSARSPLGACPSCHGERRDIAVSVEKLVPDDSRSLASDALALWADPRWKHEKRRVLEFAARVGISIEQPFRKLSPDAKQQLLRGDSGSDFDGVSGFLKRLRRREQQPSIRRYLAQWCEVRECSACSGTGLRSAALAVRLIDAASQIRLTFADCLAHPIDELLVELRHWATTLSTTERDVAKNLLPELFGRLEFLVDLGLGRLSLGRSLDTLSHGEAQRVALSGIFASRLVNTLFVLDEPSAGLHDRDFERVILGLRRLRDAGNTVVVIEHEAAFLQAADHNIEIGPAAGSEGGQLIYSGDFAGLCECAASPTAAMWQLFPAPLAPVLRGEGRGGPDKNRERRPPTSWLELTGVEHHSLHDFNVRLPLGCLCVVTGVSGSGKSLLIQETLWPALCQTLQQPCDVASPGRFKALLGAERLDDVQLVDDSPLQGGSRSNPSTWLKLFDEIRRLYAESPEAKQRGLTASYFSFNNDRGGRCPKCKGTGSVAIDMQFLADVVMHCPECHGSRFRREALEVTWRSLSIADVLAMTTSDAFVFFKGQPSLQKRLKSLKDVGLGYLTLGQPLNTLSGGEAQRLKLAATLSRTSRARTLLLMNEPTTGLHPRDVERLLECFRNLVNVGHSLIVIEHSRQVIEAADYVVEMPEGGSESRSD